jgi:hypothetical protein
MPTDMRNALALVFVLAGCKAGHAGAAPDARSMEPIPLLAALADVPIPTGVAPYPQHPSLDPKWDWSELTACTKTDRCPATDEGNALRKATASFACATDIAAEVPLAPNDGTNFGEQISLAGTKYRFAVPDSESIEAAWGSVHVAVKPGDAKAFLVAGCHRWGVVACVTGNRSLRTVDTTYENTSDRLCVWAEPISPSGQTSQR